MKYAALRITFVSVLVVLVLIGLAYNLLTNLKIGNNEIQAQNWFSDVFKPNPTPLTSPSSLAPLPLGAEAGFEEEQVAAIVERAAPSVVSIVLTKELPVYERYYGRPFSDPFACEFFGSDFCDDVQVPQLRQRGTQERQVGAGSGFFVKDNGLILTNKHVVERDDVSYTVVSNDGKKYDAKVLARDPVNDLALVKIEGSRFPVLPLGDSTKVKLGHTVIAIGNALGEFRNTVSKGIVSGLSRSITAQGAISGPENLSGLIQTDAAINPGNSGGPLLNLRGEIIGINTAVAGGAQSVGFALPVNVGKRVVDQYQTQGKISYPFLGVRYIVITPEFAKAQNLPVDYGALISRGQHVQDLAIVPGSPADKAGLQENDIILEGGGQRITLDNSLDKVITNFKVGEQVFLKVYSKGQTKTVTVTLGERT